MTYFGTDGIRGHAYDTLPLLRAYQLGYALKTRYKDCHVVIGMDTRVSSPSYVEALRLGLSPNQVTFLGVVPTPVLAYETMVLNTYGVMVTASHNPYYDNGLKVFHQGIKLSKDEIRELEMLMDAITSYEHQDLTPLGITQNHYHMLYEHLTLLEPDIPYVLDAAHGAASYLVSDYIKGHIINHAPNGYNINDHCGATHLETILEATKDIPLGFSLDGDADRLLMVYQQQIVYGDMIAYILIKDHLLLGHKETVALSIMTNPGVIEAFERLGVTVYSTPVGDSYLIEAIKQGHATYGAEASGHIITPHIHMGDGILIMKLLLDIIFRRGLETVVSWLHEISLKPMETVNLKAPKSVLDNPLVKAFIDLERASLETHEKIIVRPSGTEPLIRITVSKKTEPSLQKTLKRIIEVIEGVL